MSNRSTKILNTLRKFLFKNRLAESIIYLLIKSKIFYSIFSKLPVNYFQYKSCTYRIVKRNGILYKLDIHHYMEWAVYFNIEIEPRKCLYQNSYDKGVIFDIGAYFGEITLNLAKLNPHSKIISFEPNPEMFNKLSFNTLLNKFDNIDLYPFAAGENNADVMLTFYSESPEGAHIDTLVTQHSIPVKQKKLDDIYFEKYNDIPVKLIKIDTEGYELNVLKGAKQILSKYKPDLLLECNGSFMSRYNYTIKDLLDFLKNLGYSYFLITQSNTKLDTNNLDYEKVPKHFDLLVKK